jgi:hypothetical protein
MLTYRKVQGAETTTELIWQKQVSLKAFMLALRLFRNRLLTKDNLIRGNIFAQSFAWLAAGEWKQHNTCSFFDQFLHPCGAWFERGLVYSRLIHFCCKTILSNLSILQEVHDLAALSCSCFGYVAFRWFGMNRIVEFLWQMNQLSINC